MSTERMAGNQEYAWSYDEESPEWAQVHAIRALAYEQRTANLIAQLAAGPVDMTDWPQPVRELWFASNRAVVERLGQDT